MSVTFTVSKPNVLLICADDLKPVPGCCGDRLVKTPHIDRPRSAATSSGRTGTALSREEFANGGKNK